MQPRSAGARDGGARLLALNTAQQSTKLGLSRRAGRRHSSVAAARSKRTKTPDDDSAFPPGAEPSLKQPRARLDGDWKEEEAALDRKLDYEVSKALQELEDPGMSAADCRDLDVRLRRVLGITLPSELTKGSGETENVFEQTRRMESCVDPAAEEAEAEKGESDDDRFSANMWPSVAGLPPNEEIDAYHEHLRKECLGPEVYHHVNIAEQSPFGPVMSSGSLDDMSPVTLNQLLLSKAPKPDYCLQLTVVVSAFAAACVMAIVADSTGQHIRLSVYNTGAKNDGDARNILPLGARFALKNPFLKRCNDRWLGLRVDDPMSLVRLDLLPLQPGSRLLVLGDGDLSFSAALARHDRNSSAGGPRAHITATSLDNEEQLLQKYQGAEANLDELRADPGVTVLHGVDATQLRRFTDEFCFDKIVWNFPYPTERVIHGSAEGQLLMAGFFGCAGQVLQPGGELRITMAPRQGGSTHEVAATARNWDLEALALTHGFDLREVVRVWRDAHASIAACSWADARAPAERRCPLRLPYTKATSRGEPSTTTRSPFKAHACMSLFGALRPAAHRPTIGRKRQLHLASATSSAS